MRKEIKTVIGLAMLAGLAFGYVSNQADKASDIVAENVEALAGDGEQPEIRVTCYSAIEEKAATWTRYCGTCDIIYGAPGQNAELKECVQK